MDICLIIVDGNDFRVCDSRSIGFGDLELEFHVTLGQVDVVWGRFNAEFNGTATLDSTCLWEGFQTVSKPSSSRGTMRNV